MITAGLLYRWDVIKCIEHNEFDYDMAKNLISTCKLLGHKYFVGNTIYHLSNYLKQDFIEADVVFFDATQVGFDEYLSLKSVRNKLKGLVAGSYIIILTHAQNFSIGNHFMLMDFKEHVDQECPVYSYLYKTALTSIDARAQKVWKGKLLPVEVKTTVD